MDNKTCKAKTTKAKVKTDASKWEGQVLVNLQCKKCAAEIKGEGMFERRRDSFYPLLVVCQLGCERNPPENAFGLLFGGTLTRWSTAPDTRSR
eukprot:CAMPEP_0171853942 /NCGR_PEP_ID=MMETSP0992-20121227/22565_1 /TAXON_ID=483369 /ORGANISM="non described non described, Strain CCMP2098" /LENGTH=92 /DNA_ID=CAMNT_0012474425 /DNA_START=30 /DNA_END=304 /DNA_ORIENTATION=-